MKSKYAAFAALDPFFDVIQRGLAGLVDGKHGALSGDGDGIVLNGADALVVHPCRDGRVVVLEYEVYGRVVASDATYENRFVSIVTIENRKVVLWRDYMDSLAVMRALSR